MTGTTPAPGSGDPAKWRSLAASLRAQISDGTLKPGQPAPSATGLAAARGWSRQTCARALRNLAGEGLLTRYPGLGYYVT
jgi:DNA-binding GntR family transcriptional regulator